MSGREFEIIERYFSGFVTYTTDNVILGPGDDCAILDVPEGFELAVSTDTFSAGVHFPLDALPNVVAHRCFNASLSDLAAMGASPLAFTLALTMPAEEETWLEGFSSSLRDLVCEFEIPLVGGNMSQGGLSCTFAVMGLLPRGKGLRRNGARAGDDIYVSGTLGDAAGGLRLLGMDVQGATHLLDRYQFPVARLALGQALRDIATSAIDISDGLSSEIAHICRSSGVAAHIRLEDIPISESLGRCFGKEQATRLALAGGDDYELCFTASSSMRDRIRDISRIEAVALTRIGEVVSGAGASFFDAMDRPFMLSESGYQHFHEN